MGASGFGLVSPLWSGVFLCHPPFAIFVPVFWAFWWWPRLCSLVHHFCAGIWLRVWGHSGGLRLCWATFLNPLQGNKSQFEQKAQSVKEWWQRLQPTYTFIQNFEKESFKVKPILQLTWKNKSQMCKIMCRKFSDSENKKGNLSKVIILKMISILILRVQESLLLQYLLINCSSHLLL